MRRHLPGFLGPELYTKTCLYTIPSDQNFVLGPLPEHPQVSVFVGAGHAYKFAALIGRIPRDLALDGDTTYPIEAFGLERDAISDPAFKETFHV